MAARSPGVVMLYLEKAVLREEAARVASAHSAGKGAPVQDAVLGSIVVNNSGLMEPVCAWDVAEDGGEIFKDMGA